jgi:hypothetical protein
MKTGSDALGTVKNEYGRAKHQKQDATHSAPPKTSPGAQNMKTGPDALDNAENEFGHAKHESGN